MRTLPMQYATKIVAAVQLFFVAHATLAMPILMIKLTTHWAEETNNRVAGNRCGSSMGPAASPYHGTASDHPQATQY